jgi:hypothetical protein
VAKTTLALEAALNQDWVGADAIQSLLGLMNFVAQVLVPGGWRTCWTVLAMKMAVHRGFAPMNGYWSAELTWWVVLLRDWSRVAMMVPPTWLLPLHAAHLAPFTDASRAIGGEGRAGHGGAGAVFGRLAMQFDFTPEEIRLLPICDTEGLVSVLWLKMLCERCPDEISGRRFVTWCDNKSFVGAVNAHKSNAPTLAFLLEVLHDLMARYSFDLRIRYVKSAENVAADAASRNEWERFYEFMESVGVPRNEIVMLPVQETVRRSWSSRLRSIRTSQARMKESQGLE